LSANIGVDVEEGLVPGVVVMNFNVTIIGRQGIDKEASKFIESFFIQKNKKN
jgi:hypothetical protein